MFLLLPLALAGEPVEARVDGVAITTAEVEATIAQLPRYEPALRELVVEHLVDITLLDAEARRRKIGKSKADKLRIELGRREVLARIVTDAYVAEHSTDAELRAWYDANLAMFSRPEARAHHLLVGSEAEAEAARARIQAGEGFEAVADATSRDPSVRANHGDLGWFERGAMVPEFEAAAFDNAPGSMLTVQTQFGWHLLQVDGHRDAMPFEEARSAILAMRREDLEAGFLAELRGKAKIER